MKKTGIVSALVVLLLMVVVYALALAAAISRGAEPAEAPCPAMESPRHEALDRLAQDHADSMARRQHQDHAGFASRAAVVRKATGCREVAEICAESWEWQRDDPPEKLWAEFVKCWKQSSGHWSVASVKHKWIGMAMARGRNGVFYGVVICCD